MHFYYCAGINSQSFAGADGSGHTHCGSGRECNTLVAGAGQKFSESGRERDEENSPAQGSTTFPQKRLDYGTGPVSLSVSISSTVLDWSMSD